MKKNSLQIYILSRDRPQYLFESVASACAQVSNGISIEVIVSDNSEFDFVKEMMTKDFPNVKYIRRWPTIDSQEHFKKVIEEASSEFVVLFHDDDVLLPSYCEKMLHKMQSSLNIAAVGCNAFIMDRDLITNKKAFSRFVELQTFYDEKSFLQQYLVEDGLGVAPFSSYMYRNSMLDLKHINYQDGGKYSDGLFISK